MNINSNDLIPIIILNWNGVEDTLICIKSIINSNTNGFFIILIDNGSNKENLINLKNECNSIFKQITYLQQNDILNNSNVLQTIKISNDLQSNLFFIENEENIGFAAGNNIGLKFCDILGLNWAFLLNNDTVVTNDSLHHLISFRNKYNDYIAFTPQIRCFNDKNLIWNCGGRLTYFGSRKYHYANKHYKYVPKLDFFDINFITGCALFFNFKETGILSENYFFGEEDYELSLRLNLNKNKIACVTNSIIYHKVGSTINKNSNLYGSIYIHYINRLLNTKNYYSKIRWQFTKLLYLVYLPILLYRSNCNIKYSLVLIQKILQYIKNNNIVTKNEFLNSKYLNITKIETR